MASPLRAQSWSAYHLSLAHIRCYMPSRILSVRHVCKSPGWSCLRIWYLTISDFILILAECLRRYFLDGILKKYQYINKNINTEYLPKIPIQMATPMPLVPMCLTVFFRPKVLKILSLAALDEPCALRGAAPRYPCVVLPCHKARKGKITKGREDFQKHLNMTKT